MTGQDTLQDHTGNVVAAMSLSVPAYRFYPNREQYRMAIVKVNWSRGRGAAIIIPTEARCCLHSTLEKQ